MKNIWSWALPHIKPAVDEEQQSNISKSARVGCKEPIGLFQIADRCLSLGVMTKDGTQDCKLHHLCGCMSVCLSGGSKPAKLETGGTIMVPLFIQQGEKIRVDTRSDSYLGRSSE
jgi:Elongation factor P, C-terminal